MACERIKTTKETKKAPQAKNVRLVSGMAAEEQLPQRVLASANLRVCTCLTVDQ